jgi:hypothetical protein
MEHHMMAASRCRKSLVIHEIYRLPSERVKNCPAHVLGRRSGTNTFGHAPSHCRARTRRRKLSEPWRPSSGGRWRQIVASSRIRQRPYEERYDPLVGAPAGVAGRCTGFGTVQWRSGPRGCWSCYFRRSSALRRRGSLRNRLSPPTCRGRASWCHPDRAAGRCYTPTTNCPLSDQRLIGHPSS